MAGAFRMSRASVVLPLLVGLILLASYAAATTSQQSSRLRGRSLAAFEALEKNATRPVSRPRDGSNGNGDGSASDAGSTATTSSADDDQEAADEAAAADSTDNTSSSGDGYTNPNARNSAESSQPAPPPPTDGCPPSASMCSFQFQGHEGTIPVFELPKGADVPIGPPVEGGVKGSSIVVRTLNSRAAEYPCTQKTGLEKLKDQFYAVNDVIQMRTIQPGDEEKLRGEIVKVIISGAALDVYNQLFNLNPGDGSSSFPEEKRCVLFQVA